MDKGGYIMITLDYNEFLKLKQDEFNNAKSVIMDAIKLDLEGLLSVAQHSDEKTAFRIRKYVDRIQSELQYVDNTY